MKKILAILLAFSAVISAGCNKNKNDSSSSDANFNLDDISFIELEPDAAPIGDVETDTASSRITVTENTFDWLTDYNIQADNYSIYMATFTCEKTSDMESGVYSSPDVEVLIGSEKCSEPLAYVLISDQYISLNVSFFGGFVEKETEISVTVHNFNALNEPEEGKEEEAPDYYDISDETVYEGTFSFKTTASKDFGYLYYEFNESLGVSSLTVTDSSCNVELCQGLFGDKTPAAQDVVIGLSDGKELTFDNCYIVEDIDEYGEPTGDYGLILNFSDESKSIDLANVTYISVNGNVLAGQ